MYLEEDFGARSGPTAASVSCSCTRNREIEFCVEGKIGRCRVADGTSMGMTMEVKPSQGGSESVGRHSGRVKQLYNAPTNE